MSGAAGGGRIPRSAVEQTVKDYSEKILSKIEGFKDAKLSGSFNRPDKEDFGDIDIIVTIETGEDKKTVKQKIATLFQSLPDSELPPLQNPKYKGKKFINHGEMVSNLYPISGMPGEYVQIDNIISLSAEEGDFKKTILDYPAELQGLILGLVKVPLLEEDPKKVFSRLGIDNIPEPKEDQEYEFHIDTSGLTLRLVTYGGNYKILDSNIVWQSRSFDDVRTLLKDFNLDGTFEDLMQQLQGLKNERSKNRVKGYFAKSIKVGAAEQGTPKGDSKQNALDAVSMLEENRRILSRAKLMTKFLDEDEKPRIAVFPGAFKPPHRDHVGRILAAANKVGEDGKVLVLISPLDRAKEGEEPISAKQAAAVFELYKEKGIIPLNVTVRVSEMNSPIGAAYKEFESDPTQPYIAVFGKDDASRYRNIEDRLPNVTPDSFEDANVGDISASDLRKAIAQRDKEVITRYLPTGITADEYLNTLGIDKPLDEGDTESAADLWTPHASMLSKMRKEPELLKGLWKGLSKPSRRALVLYFRREKQREAAAPLEEAAETVKEAQGKKLRVFDFDDTLVHVDATIYITHEDGSKEGLTPAEYAVYEPQPGDKFNFKEFSSVIKKAKPLEDNIQDLIKSYNDPTEKTTILTARLLGYPVKKYLRDEFNIEPYVVGLGSSDPQDKAKWIEDQIKKGYTTIEFRDDSAKNVDAVAALQDKHPEITLTSILIKENASYSSDIDYKGKILELTKHMLRKGMNIKPLPKVKFVNGDSDNARQFLGKTAYYDPNNKTIVLYTEGRHPKDIVRSFAHEMVHHTQNLENRLGDVSTTNTMEDSNIDKLEQEANLKGTMTFRNWTDSLNENTTTNSYPFKVNELRQGFLNYLKQQLPNFPDYVIKDWIYKMIKKDDNINTAEGIQDWIDTQLKDLKWETKINFPITMDIFGDKTQKELKSRIGGEIRQDVDKDIERHKTQQNLLKSQGISKEPLIIFKTKDGKYELGEGWHRTTQSFKMYPEGFIQPNVYIGLNAKWLDENLSKLKEANLTDSLNKNIFQKSLDQTEKEALEITYKNWDTFGGKECNNGFCDIFAKNLAKHLPGSKILSTEDPRNETLGHVWVEYEGKYFDAETPDGVSSWKDLPWMKEFYSKVRSYPTDIETLNEVGEANLKPYKWQEVDREGYSIYVRFETESETTYSVDLSTDKYKDTPVFLIEFSAKTKEHQGSSSRVVVNKGEMYRVMSTLTDIIKTYLKKFKKVKGIVYYPSKKGNEEFGTQRDNLYRAFIIKAIPGIKFEPVNTALYGDGIVALMPDTVVKEIVTGTFRNWTDSLNESTTTNSYPFKVTDKTYDDEDNSLITVSYELTTPDNSYRVEFYSGEHRPEAKTFDLSFGVNTGDLNTIDTFQMTGEGNARKIFKTILNIVEDFINKEDVKKIVVDGTDEKRKRIYKAIFSSTPPNIYDKIELKEAKNKDPFGLNQYARELAQGLEETIVMEGRYDTISNQISSEIFNNWKAQFDKNNTTEEALFTKSYDLENAAGRPIVFDLVASLTFKETEEGTYSVNGDADEGDEEVYDADGELEDEGLDGSISMYFQVDPRELPRLWSKISMDLKDIVRHEIEHLTQAGYNVVDSKRLPDDRMLRMYIQDLKTMPERDYYLLDKEIPAMLQGMYFKAKKMKEPFAKVVNDYLTIQKVSDEDREIILNRWRPAAKTLNLPNL